MVSSWRPENLSSSSTEKPDANSAPDSAEIPKDKIKSPNIIFNIFLITGCHKIRGRLRMGSLILYNILGDEIDEINFFKKTSDFFQGQNLVGFF